MSIYGYNSQDVQGTNLTAGAFLVGGGGSKITTSSGGGGGGISTVTSTDGCIDVQTTGSTVDLKTNNTAFARWLTPAIDQPQAVYCTAGTQKEFLFPPSVLTATDFTAVTGGIQYTGSNDVTLN